MAQRVRRAVPLGWELRVSRRKGKPYYVNLINGDTQWEKPGKRPSLCTNEVFSLSDEGPLKRERPTRIICCHILIKHNICADRKGRKGQLIKRTRMHAFKKAKAIYKQLLEKKIGFKTTAYYYSDCWSAVDKGLLKPITVGSMDEEFEDAAFKLKLGEISKPFETRAGFHIIKRIQ